jgi:predicted metal-dependent phosphoesterase TrpH
MFDLHCHTTASDGLLTPTELVARASSDRVEGIAVTDHDTMAGVAEAEAAGRSAGIRVVPGIEISTRWSDRNVHMLGYFLAPDAPPLIDAVEALRSDRASRAERIVGKLNELGYEISMDEVRAQAGDAKMIVRPHIARVLVAKGYVGSVREAFTQELIADGGRADVPKAAMPSAKAVELIRASGGAAVIAHAAVGHHDGDAKAIPHELIDELVDAGLAGIEVDHPDHPPLVRDELRALASRLGLVATGGSDFHGEIGHALGSSATLPEALAALEARAGS